ncbi:FkbM family methyltransferase [Bordetella sp. 2513F-2]
MSFISYAQNFEDVMLRRALKHVEAGFYIDVGAAWPDEDSVTKAFYDCGWSGINVEPNPAFHALLQQQRPRDVNLPVAVGDHAGEVVMHFIGGTGLSSVDTDVIEAHRQSGWSAEQKTVRLQTLTDIWKAHVPAGQEVHFVKIDVEGLEAQVLRGHDWSSCRPWIVLVEATQPSTQTESHDEWEPILLQGGYDHVYADGLNRFYVAREHAGLAAAFRYPPNVFDQFVRASEAQAESVAADAERETRQALARAEEAEACSRQLEERIQETEHRLRRAEAAAQAAQRQCELIYRSTSWRLTRPVRLLGAVVRGHGREVLKPHAARLIRRLAAYGQSRPWFRKAALLVLDRMPGLKHRLFSVATRPSTDMTSATVESHQLTPRAQQVHATLQFAMKHHQKEES